MDADSFIAWSHARPSVLAELHRAFLAAGYIPSAKVASPTDVPWECNYVTPATSFARPHPTALRVSARKDGDRTEIRAWFDYPVRVRRIARLALILSGTILSGLLFLAANAALPHGTESNNVVVGILAPFAAVVLVLELGIEVFPGGARRARKQTKHLLNIVTEGHRQSPYAVHLSRRCRTPYGFSEIGVGAVYLGAAILGALVSLFVSNELVLADVIVIGSAGGVAYLFAWAARGGERSHWLSIRQQGLSATLLSYAALALGSGYFLLINFVAFRRFGRPLLENPRAYQDTAVLESELNRVVIAQSMAVVALLASAIVAITVLRRLGRTWVREVAPVKVRGELTMHGPSDWSLGQRYFLLCFFVLWALGLWYGILETCRFLLASITSSADVSVAPEWARPEVALRWANAQLPALGFGVSIAFLCTRFLGALRRLKRTRAERTSLEGCPSRSLPRFLLDSVLISVNAEVRILPTEKLGAWSMIHGGAGPPMIVITQGTLDVLSEEDVQVVLAHEVGHCVLHQRSLERLRTLSACLFLEPSVLTLLVNFPAIEMEADAYAWRVLGGDSRARDQVISCLQKLRGLVSPGESWHRSRRMNAFSSVGTGSGLDLKPGVVGEASVGLRLLLSGDLAFYEHPSFKARIEAIKRVAGNHVAGAEST